MIICVLFVTTQQLTWGLLFEPVYINLQGGREDKMLSTSPLAAVISEVFSFQIGYQSHKVEDG